MSGIKGKKLLAFLAFAALLALKYRWPSYYPILDDHILFWGYPAYPDPWNDCILRLGLLNVRPFAGLLDIYFWGFFWEKLYIALGLIMALHILSAFIMQNVLRRSGVETGAVFLGVYFLMPMGFEGAYWLSAATRIIVGLFFAVAAARVLLVHLESKGILRALYLLLFAPLQILSFGFYEQVAICSALLCFLVMLTHRRRAGGALFITLINISALVAYYLIFGKTGEMGHRAEIVALDKLGDNALYVMEMAYSLFKSGLYELNAVGFSRAVEMLFAEGVRAAFYVGASALLAALAAAHYGDAPKSGKRGGFVLALVFGLLLIVMPFAPYPLLKVPHMGYRNGFIALIGLGIVLDALLRSLRLRWVYAGAAVLLIVFMMTVNYAEMSDYEAVSRIDREICEKIVATLSPDVLRGEREAVLLNAKPHYAEQSARFGEHIDSLTQSDWALTGGVRAAAKNLKIKRITPVEGRKVPEGVGGERPQVLWLGQDFWFCPFRRSGRVFAACGAGLPAC